MDRVLIIDDHFYHYGKAIEECFKKAGYEVQRLSIQSPLNFRIRLYNGYVKLYQDWFDYDRQFPRLKQQIEMISKEVLAAYKAFQPQTVLFIKADYINRATLQKMGNAELYVWMMDSYERFPFLIEDLDLFSGIYVFEENDVGFLKARGIEAKYLPLCADKRIYYPIESKKDIDILFVGTLYPNRMKILRKVIDYFPQYHVKCYGYYARRYEFIKKWFFKHSKRYKNIYETTTSEETNQLYSRSKICLNIHNSQTKAGANPRTFEILAAR